MLCGDEAEERGGAAHVHPGLAEARACRKAEMWQADCYAASGNPGLAIVWKVAELDQPAYELTIGKRLRISGARCYGSTELKAVQRSLESSASPSQMMIGPLI